jgi:predicted ATPase
MSTTPKEPALVVVTGGPGAGKTALLEVVKRTYGARVVVLPEAASMLFGGGFPRRTSDVARRAAQRAIFRVQRELERIALDESAAPVILCDRGTVDGAAYWPGDPVELFRELGTSLPEELARYALVIHLRTPLDGHGYDHTNPVRIESATQAHAKDEQILEAWKDHPRRVVIDTADDFRFKVARALEVLDEVLAGSAAPATT